MKTIIASVAAVALSVSAVFAENTLHIGMYVPISNLTVAEGSASTAFATTGFGGSLDYTHVAGSGFTFKIGLGVAGANSYNLTTPIEGKNLTGPDFDLGFGFGGSVIHDEKMTLSLTGNLGFRVQMLSGSDRYKVFNAKTSTIDTEMESFLFYIGPEISYTFRFNRHIGLFANFGIFYNTGGSSYLTLGGPSEIRFDFTYTTLGFNFQPKFGLAVTF